MLRVISLAHPVLPHRTQTVHPLRQRLQHVLEDLLADHLARAELSHAGRSDRLHTKTRVLLDQLQHALQHLRAAFLLERHRQRHRHISNRLQSDEHHTRMDYPSHSLPFRTVVQSVQHHRRDPRQIRLHLLLAAVCDVTDQHVRRSADLPVLRAAALRDQLRRRLVHRSVQRAREVSHHLRPISRPLLTTMPAT